MSGYESLFAEALAEVESGVKRNCATSRTCVEMVGCVKCSAVLRGDIGIRHVDVFPSGVIRITTEGHDGTPCVVAFRVPTQCTSRKMLRGCNVNHSEFYFGSRKAMVSVFGVTLLGFTGVLETEVFRLSADVESQIHAMIHTSHAPIVPAEPTTLSVLAATGTSGTMLTWR